MFILTLGDKNAGMAHELIRNLIGGTLAVLHLYGKDDYFGSDDLQTQENLDVVDWFLIRDHGPYL